VNGTPGREEAWCSSIMGVQKAVLIEQRERVA
jgi:hypothetical protein